MRHLLSNALLSALLMLPLPPAPLAELTLEPVHGSKRFPPLDLQDLNQQAHSLSNYRDKVVLVSFWASWCTPCVTEMPGMQRLADSLKDQPFMILAVNVSEPENRIQEFLRRMNLRLTVLMDREGDTMRAWHGKVLPTSFLVDRAGSVRYRASGPLEWDSEEVRKIIEGLIHNP